MGVATGRKAVTMLILMIGDVVGQPGRRAVRELLLGLRKQYGFRQLENEQLRTQLMQYKERLVDLQAQIVKATKANAILQDKFKEISGMLETQGGDLSERGIKKVDVELIPKAEVEGENE